MGGFKQAYWFAMRLPHMAGTPQASSDVQEFQPDAHVHDWCLWGRRHHAILKYYQSTGQEHAKSLQHLILRVRHQVLSLLHLEHSYGNTCQQLTGSLQENLLLLHKKLDYAEKDEVALTSAALRDVAPELDALRSKAVAKARDFLMARIYALRKPKTNIQVCSALLEAPLVLQPCMSFRPLQMPSAAEAKCALPLPLPEEAPAPKPESDLGASPACQGC